MGAIRKSEKVKLIVGMISSDSALFDKVKIILEKKLRNQVDLESHVLNFTHTDYYYKEMGLELKRKFLSFKRVVSLNKIERIKILTNLVEGKFSRKGNRAINIDPGYIDLSKLVLLSTKDYTHRIHIGSGIFAEITLYYKDKKFNPWPWTYPDYKTDEYLSLFNSIREIYKNKRDLTNHAH